MFPSVALSRVATNPAGPVTSVDCGGTRSVILERLILIQCAQYATAHKNVGAEKNWLEFCTKYKENSMYTYINERRTKSALRKNLRLAQIKSVSSAFTYCIHCMYAAQAEAGAGTILVYCVFVVQIRGTTHDKQQRRSPSP